MNSMYGRKSRAPDEVAHRLKRLHRSAADPVVAGEVVPARYHDAHLLHMHSSPGRDMTIPILKAWVGHGIPARRWLWLTGAYGCGKTHVMAALLRAANAGGYSCAWRSWSDLVLRMLRVPTDRAKRQRLMQVAMSADVLFLDDFAKSGHDLVLDAKELGLAWQLLDARYAARLPTVISCQADFRFVRDAGDIGAALYSRIHGETFPEAGAWVSLGADDLRGVADVIEVDTPKQSELTLLPAQPFAEARSA